MFLKNAMRYYRLWIYTCNAVLLISVIVFVCVASYFLSDSRRTLVTSIKLYHPSFIYAYAALVMQGGILQLIGCIGALKLNEKLLNIYWLLMLVLLLGDVVVGFVWIFRFDRICAVLRPNLKEKLVTEYVLNTDFTYLLNTMQSQSQCCGIEGPKDFNRTWWYESLQVRALSGHLLPESCCKKFQGHINANGKLVSLSSSVVSARNSIVKNLSSVNRSASHVMLEETKPQEKDNVKITLPNGTCFVSEESGDEMYTTGCGEKLIQWLRQSADILFVIGYCVIAFLKLCFLGILRYEIKEMIQKIKVLQGDSQGPSYPELAAALGMNSLGMSSPQSSLQEKGIDSLANTPLHHAKLNHLAQDGTDSETNSNCALISEKDKHNSNGNNNEVHELKEMNRHIKQTQI